MKRKIMALDVGDKTIGVAVSDALLLTAQGITTIDRIGIRKDTAKVLELIKEHNYNTLNIKITRKFTKNHRNNKKPAV